METHKNYRKMSALGLIASLALLPGCWPNGESDKKSQSSQKEQKNKKKSEQLEVVIASLNGKPLLTEKEFNSYMTQIEKTQPGFREYLMQDPNGEATIIENLIDGKILANYWVKDEGLLDSEEYQKDLKKSYKLINMQHAARKFESEIIDSFEPTEKQIKNYYEKNKEQFLKKYGGVNAQEVVFSDEKEALEFLKKAKTHGANFKELAQEAGKEVSDLGRVTKETMSLDEKIVKTLGKITKTPSVDLIKVNDEFHVIYSTDKTADEYFSLEDASEDIEKVLKFEEAGKRVYEKKQELRKKYNVEVNEDFLNKLQEGNFEKILAALAQQAGVDVEDLKNEIRASQEANFPAEATMPESA